MKLSLNWAQYYSNVDIKNIDKQTLLSKIGEQLGGIDEVVEWGQKFDGIVVAKVISCEKHENADKLSICLIDDGGVVEKVKRDKNGLVQVVCGAPNVAAGQLVAWIPPGATVPTTFDKDPLVLDARELRGVLSNGMLASASELGISNDHSGILVIDPAEVGDKNIKRGTPFKNLYGLDDTIVDIENKMFTHRPDCFGILGLARELAGINHLSFKSPDWYDEFAQIESETKPLPLLVKNWSDKQVPRFCLSAVAGVQVKASPYFMQSALARVGIKPINNIVDVTNFVMHLTGQPIHAYDYDKVKGSKESAEIAVRLSKKGEELTLLGGKKLKLEDGAIVITDGTKPIGLAGIMGGAETEVDDSTKNIIIECGNFDMNLIRKTSMTYGLFTDASTRFTKGQSPRQNMAVLAYAVGEIKKYAGGQVAGKTIDLKARKFDPKQVLISDAKVVGGLLGLPGLTLPAIKHLLKNVEFTLSESSRGLMVEAPFWRTDIEIVEDIVEEVGRLYGYSQLPLALPVKAIDPAPANPNLEIKTKIRNILASAGANEVLTYSFIPGALLEASGQSARNTYHIKNALSPEVQYYRMSVVPSLLEKVHANIKQGYKEFGIFEMGAVHNRNIVDKEQLPQELSNLAFVITKNKIAGAPYYWAKHYLEFLLSRLNIFDLEFMPVGSQKSQRHSVSFYETNRSSYVSAGGQIIGVLGEPNQALVTRLKLPAATAMFEVDLAQLEALSRPIIYKSLNRFPSTEQDLCLKTEASVSYGELSAFVAKTIASLSKNHGYQYTLSAVDIYQKEAGGKDKQTTWRISLAHPSRTLTTTETNKLLDDVAAQAKLKLKAERI